MDGNSNYKVITLYVQNELKAINMSYDGQIQWNDTKECYSCFYREVM